MRVNGIGVVLSATLLVAGAWASPQATQAPTYDDIDAAGAAIARVLDGRIYSVDTGKLDQPASGKDVVRFADGIMSTDLCIRFGFKPAPYFVRVEGSKLHFRSEMISETQGKLVFTGYIEGNTLKANAAWEKVRWYWTVNIVLWFDGALAAPGDPLRAFLN